MIKTILKLKSSILIISGIILLVYLTGCDKKAESPNEKQTPQISSDTTKPDALPSADSSNAPKEEKIDLTGRWTGTFDQRSATLKITGQNDNEFTGTLTVAYREPLTKAVSGKFDMETMKFSMNDTQHSRYKGNYGGIITDESKMSGTFTMDIDKKNYSFSLTKK